MGKRGPKLRKGKREPNGQLDRRTHTERLNAMTQEDSARMKAVALAQPHRRGDEDKRRSYAAGRFCQTYGLADAILTACDEYLTAELRWLSGYGCPRGLEQHNGGSGAGPTPEQMAGWLAKVKRVKGFLVATYGHDGFMAVRKLVIEDAEPKTVDYRMLRSALFDMAIVLNCVEKNPHPFFG